jgi:hypothetical protein
MKCVNFRRVERGSLVGFADLQMDSGLIVFGCALHAWNSRRWVNPPGRPRLDSDQKPMLGDDGKVLYSPVIDFATDETRFRWSAQAVKAIEAYQSKAPTEASAKSRENASQWHSDQGVQGGP